MSLLPQQKDTLVSQPMYSYHSVTDIGYQYNSISTSNKANILSIGPGHEKALDITTYISEISVHMEVCIDGAHAEKKQLKLGLVVKENRRRRK